MVEKPHQGTFIIHNHISLLIILNFIIIRFMQHAEFHSLFFRYELLSMVKKHSNLIGKTVVEEQDAPDVEMDMKFWHDVFDLYFVRGKESRGRQDDDLVFFVRKLVSPFSFPIKHRH
jgi:hypothetical protein